MAPDRDLRKFPKGERCEFCGSRKWYLENGLRYCAKEGHQLQGYVEFDLGDEDFGQKGRVSRKEKQVKERVKRVLSGQPARDLYLECIQLILREQILWLVTVKGHKAELETVVRDLWDFRIRGAATVAENDYESEAELLLFSSQVDLSQDEQPASRFKRAQSWVPQNGTEWPAPRLIDTLGLCFLGCLLLRIPTRVGDFARWARDGHILYKEAYRHLPQEMCDRLPSWYATTLKSAHLAKLDQGELHASVVSLALSYRLNYGMIFPPFNDVLMTLQYVRELGLPVETIPIARRIPPIVNLAFDFQLDKPRIRLIHQPEILLVAIIVLTTIQCFPFETNNIAPHDDGYFSLPNFDWAEWQRFMAPILGHEPAAAISDYTNVTALQIISMEPGELDEYFAQLSLLTDTQEEGAMLAKYFPFEERPPTRPVSEAPEDETVGRLRTLQSEATSFANPMDEADREESNTRNGRYYSYRSEDDLPAVGRDFFQLAARLAGLSVPMLLRAVNMLETHIVGWQREQRRVMNERRERSAMDVDS